MSAFNVGDRVVVVSDVRPQNIGRIGTIVQVEKFQQDWPYRVEFDDAEINVFDTWVFDEDELRAEDEESVTTQ